MTKLRTSRTDWRHGLIWIGPLLVVIGFFTERMWQSLPAPRVLETVAICGLALAVAFLACRLARFRLATALASVFAVATIWFVGAMPALSVLLFVAAAFSIGHRIAGDREGAAATIVGLSAISGTVGWFLPFPVHYRFVYIFLFAIAAAIERKRLLDAARRFSRAWQSAVSEAPGVAAFAILAAGLAFAVCWLPTVQFDDLAYHLGLPSQLSALHYYRMDVQSQVWALAPWSGDIVQGVAQMIAGAESRGAVDAVWLALIGALTWTLAGTLDMTPRARWFAVALAASQPMTAWLAGGMQAELPAAAAALALALTVAQSDRLPNIRNVLAFALIAGFLLALKTGFVAIVVPLAVWFGWRCRGRWSVKAVAAAFLSMLLVSGSSYVYAALITGDPFFPLFSDAFHARFPADVMSDAHWTAPVDASILWQLTFHTVRYVEGWNGAAGFSLLGLSGAAIVALCTRATRALAICALVAFVAAIATVHYFRYAYPAVILLTPATVAVAAAVTPARIGTLLFSSLIALNLAYQSCANWTLHVGGIKRRLMDIDTVAEINRYAPARGLVRAVSERSPDAVVLFCSPGEPFAAELAGRGLTVSQYDPELERARIAADEDPTGAAWRGIFERTNAQYAIVSHKDADSGALMTALADAKRILEIGSDQLWQLPARSSASIDLVRARDIARGKFQP